MDPATAFAAMLPKFLLVLLRSSVFLAVLPVLGSKSFPARFRIGLAVALAIVLTPVVEFEVDPRRIPALAAREVMLALGLGLAARAVFMAVEIAGQLASDSLGLSIASTFNPEIGPSTDLARFQGVVATLLFFATDSHHDLVAVLVRSYDLVPAGAVRPESLLPQAVSIAGSMFAAAAKLSAPVVAGVLTTNLLLGFVYKSAPQVNVFFAAFPLLVFAGLLLILLTLPAFVSSVAGSFGGMREAMARVLAAARE